MSARLAAAQVKTEALAATVGTVFETYQKTYADYRALPEEADAWNSGGRVADAILANLKTADAGSH